MLHGVGLSAYPGNTAACAARVKVNSNKSGRLLAGSPAGADFCIVRNCFSDRDEPPHDDLDDLQVFFYLCPVTKPLVKLRKQNRHADPTWVVVSRFELAHFSAGRRLIDQFDKEMCIQSGEWPFQSRLTEFRDGNKVRHVFQVQMAKHSKRESLSPEAAHDAHVLFKVVRHLS